MNFFFICSLFIISLQIGFSSAKDLPICKNINYVPQAMLKLKLEKKREQKPFPFVFDKNNQPEALRVQVKSEPVPEYNGGNVKLGVGKTFYDMVIDNNKDTFVVLYAPWCPYCQAMMPDLDTLGDMLKDESVSIVKMDATKNDAPPNYEVPGYPTIYWAPKESKSYPQKYEGSRKANDMLKFIAQHSTNELKNYDRNGNVKSSN